MALHQRDGAVLSMDPAQREGDPAGVKRTQQGQHGSLRSPFPQKLQRAPGSPVPILVCDALGALPAQAAGSAAAAVPGTCAPTQPQGKRAAADEAGAPTRLLQSGVGAVAVAGAAAGMQDLSNPAKRLRSQACESAASGPPVVTFSPAPQSVALGPPVVTLFLQRCYAEAMLSGTKVWEGRPAASRAIARVHLGDCVRFRCDRRPDGLVLRARVAERRVFAGPGGLRAMLRDVGVQELLPRGPRDVEAAAAVYEAFGDMYRNPGAGGYVAWRLVGATKEVVG